MPENGKCKDDPNVDCPGWRKGCCYDLRRPSAPREAVAEVRDVPVEDVRMVTECEAAVEAKAA